MSHKLVTIGSFADVVAAHAIRSGLEGAGIQAFVSGDEVATSLWHVGSALGGVKVQVAEPDVERAFELLGEEEGPTTEFAGNENPWRCRLCQEIVEAEYVVCWSCGRDRADVQDDNFDPASLHEKVEEPSPPGDYAPNDALPNDVLPTGEPTRYAEPPITENAVKENAVTEKLASKNPFASPLGPEIAAELPAEPIQVLDEDTEAAVLRAYRAAIIGIVLCPGVLHLYSFVLLILISSRRQKLTPTSRRRFFLAYAIDIIVIVFAVTLYRVQPDWFSF